MRKILLLSGLVALAAPLAAAQPISGKWLTDDGKGVVEIAPCGAHLCGRITRLMVKAGANPTDRNNPDPALRTRPLVGLNILSGFRDTGGAWEGTIYSPERGRSFRSVVKRNADGSLAVKGCMGPICQTQRWTPSR
ncbi:MAG TPA: DUF2147 domain-containing protein [Chakrabartia sp.]|jgi:uncharacterized protein (DUF2147 family)|nr:DUF2147 domain-containing protein [Chakrabartia sp.]